MADTAATLDRQKADSLLAGDRAMAADKEREAEAESRSEALIEDGFEDVMPTGSC
jgi:hypothetical protein